MTTSSHLEEKLRFYLKLNKNVLLEGRHGVGKTALIEKIFNEEFGEGNWIYFSSSTLDPWVDLIGVPKESVSKDTAYLDFVLPKRMVDTNLKAIFFDEYNRSHKKIRNATMELIQFKSINGRKFPNLKVVWAAINPSDDEEEDYDVEQLDGAQIDRFQVKIKVPFTPDFEYFENKFGTDWAKSALEWWNGMPLKAQKMVSPRRLDYALEIHREGGDLFDVLEVETNPVKLAATLKVGSLDDKLKDLYKLKSAKKTKEFFSEENNYQASLPIIRKKTDYMKYFLPILDNERISSLFFSDQAFKVFILDNAPYFKSALEEISKLKAIDKHDLSIINRALKQVGNMTYFQ